MDRNLCLLAIVDFIPQTEVVADRFHAIKQVNQELDSQRKKSRKEAQQLENESEKEKLLSGLNKSKYPLLKNEKELTDDQKEKLEQVKKVDPILAETHSLKEQFRDIFETSSNWVEGLFSLGDWLRNAQDYFPQSFGTIRRCLGEIIAYFDTRTTQGVVEGINNKLNDFIVDLILKVIFRRKLSAVIELSSFY